MIENLKKIIYSLHPLERIVLPYVKLGDVAQIAKESDLSEPEVLTGVNMLEEKGYLIVEKLETDFIGLDKFGQKYIGKDLPEIKFLKQIINGPKKKSQLNLDDDEFSASIGILKKENLIKIEKDHELVFSAREIAIDCLKDASNPLNQFREDVEVVFMNNEQRRAFESFKQRKGFLKEFTKTRYELIYTDDGLELAKEIERKYRGLDLIEAVDSKMLKTGSWKGKEFRHYDINLDVPVLDIGRRHPMMEANNILRDVFVEMGFKEMQGPMVESAFWNMDVLWIPQDHPARDEQDTFYLEGKADVTNVLMEKVKEMHEVGIKRTHTLKNEWSEDIAKKRLLRTHSTATSFRILYELGKKLAKGKDINGKYFYVANNFRNEAIDATHLAEFYQAEGFIIGDNLSLADLMGFVKEYYAKLGIDKIRFKPTFNPYTEPSMEAHYYDPKLKKWYALINSGIFRPETLKPMGIENKTIIAWGMGASRVAALLAGKDSMRDITGATCDLEWLKTRPLMTRSIVKR